MALPMIANFLMNSMTMIFIGLIDTVCYGLLTVAYNIFYAVSQIDLFGGGGAGQLLYTNLTKRIYTILSVVMVFIFAYQLIMLVIDPEGKNKGGAVQVFKSTVISIALLVALPIVYRYMSMFQFHVLENGTIPAIIMGTNAQDSDHNPGRNVAMMVLISFFHPNGTTYNTFFDESGDLRGDAIEECNEDTAAEDGEEHTTTCEHYVAALEDWDNETHAGVADLTWHDKKLRHWVGDTMSYTWIISSLGALAVAYFFFIYAIDIGVRAVKLGVLQLISPIPVVLRIFPNTKKTFDNWFDHMKKTYLELFVRVAVIFFALEIVKLIPEFIKIIFQAQSGSMADTLTKCIATVILILGILKFGQDAPGLFKELFSAGGGLLGGVNLKPGARARIQDNKAAMWTMGKGAAMATAGVSQFRRQFAANKQELTDANNRTHWLRNTTLSLPSALRGIVDGARAQNSTPTQFSVAGMRQAAIAGADAANRHYNESERLQRNSQHTLDYINDTRGTALGLERTVQFFKNRLWDSGVKDIQFALSSRAGEIVDNAAKFHERISPSSGQTNATAASLTAIIEGLNGVKANTKDKTKAVSKEIDDLQQIVNSSVVRQDPGQFTEHAPILTGNKTDDDRKIAEYNARREAHNRRVDDYRRYEDAKALLSDAKSRRNDMIASELMKSIQGQQFAVNSFDKVLDEIKKAPFSQSDREAYANLISDLHNKAQAGTLGGSDIKSMNDLVDKLTNAKIYANALNEQNQAAFKMNESSSNGGSKPASSGDNK